MRENNRKSIASLNKFPQFTTMNVIDGQAGLEIYSSLIFYSLTIDNILNIIVLLILAGVTIATLTGENGILTQANKAKTETDEKGALEAVQLEIAGSFDNQGSYSSSSAKENLEKNLNAVVTENSDRTLSVKYKGYDFLVDVNGEVVEDTLGARISATNYGDYINYNVDLNDDGDTTNDWRVFYNDGENVFIIAADYLSNSKLPASTDMVASSYSQYSANWPSTSNLTRAGSSAISEAIANKYMLSWRNTYPTSENINIKAVAALLDTSAWNSFATGVSGAEAIGAPTLEMFLASWNARGYTTLYCDNITDCGYCLGKTPGPTSEYIVLKNYIPSSEVSDTLYFPHAEVTGGCEGYWLASPSSYWNGGCLMYVGCSGGGIWGAGQTDGTSNYCDRSEALRPVVCLPSGIKVTKGQDGIWTIQE